MSGIRQFNHLIWALEFTFHHQFGHDLTVNGALKELMSNVLHLTSIPGTFIDVQGMQIGFNSSSEQNNKNWNFSCLIILQSNTQKLLLRHLLEVLRRFSSDMGGFHRMLKYSSFCAYNKYMNRTQDSYIPCQHFIWKVMKPPFWKQA